jgi:hypothetical protein
MPAKSKAQQKFMGMVHASQKGEMKPKGAVAKATKSMTKKAATEFASTKHKNLPEKLKEGMTKGEPIFFFYILKPENHTSKVSDLVHGIDVIQFGKQMMDGKFENEQGLVGAIHGYYMDNYEAEEIAKDLIKNLHETASMLEAKKATVSDALQKKINELQKKAEEHLRLAKKEPENGEKHHDEAQAVLARIKVLRKKHKMVEGSKKEIMPLEEDEK